MFHVPRQVIFEFGTNVFEWDRLKAESNPRKHGLSFEIAAMAFEDRDAVIENDEVHSEEEERFILIGRVDMSRIVAVVHVVRGERLRLISARQATAMEEWTYDFGRGNGF